MKKNNLGKLTKSQLIELLLQSQKPVPTPRQIVQDNKPIPAPRNKKPIPTPRTKIEQAVKALRGYTQSYEIGIKNDKDPLIQMNDTRLAIENLINSKLNEMKGLKFVETLKVTFVKIDPDERRKIMYKTAFFNSSATQIINRMEIAYFLQLSEKRY